MTDLNPSPGKATLLPCPFCGGEAQFERHGTNRQSSIVSCQECGARVETGETWNEGQLWNTRVPAQRAPGWIDQNHQIDRYGVALMMVGLGCADPAGLATRVLSEFGVSLTSTARRTLPVMVPDKNSASGYRIENLNIEVDADLAKALDGSALSSPNRGASDV